MKKSLAVGLITTILLGHAGLLTASHVQAAVTVQKAGLTGTVQYGVNLRVSPSTSARIVKLLKAGETVSITAKDHPYFYKVVTSGGQAGYVSKSEKYIKLNAGGDAETGNQDQAAAQPELEKKLSALFQTARKYLGTPYEYGSDRSTVDTFDCSDFSRQIYREALNIILPADSRAQGQWIKTNSTAVFNMNELRPGDLIFFMGYKGSSSDAYQGIDRTTERINHVGVYLGNGQMIHTYSVSSGGVRIDTLTGSWAKRFLYGGSVLQ
ncbi:SH3 domain-containing C40 family peptidase [Paenibacillus sp. YPG26]|uniref:C40 family peptidase n=1 Tax=Paenibacillus sp. YPG26 TaxID=2878915 RepID=UPI00203D1A8C|nr:SH3 domain-containing C40 family peptidase [Paenibacillus sp. YPG26]USB32630.1 C40 family peptidase [Paenibacillus sp. YPG26]